MNRQVVRSFIMPNSEYWESYYPPRRSLAIITSRTAYSKMIAAGAQSSPLKQHAKFTKTKAIPLRLGPMIQDGLVGWLVGSLVGWASGWMNHGHSTKSVQRLEQSELRR
jgi:hypothetical protein